MERRQFLMGICGLCGVSVAGNLLESCGKQNLSGPTNVNFTIDLTNTANANLKTVGGYVVQNGVIVIRSAANTYNALSATCTHQGCTVGYDPGSHDIVCPCHGGTYNLSGNVLGGPPPAPLSTYTVTQSGNILTIKS